MVVITPPTNNLYEASLINEMFERGLPLLHVRKPSFLLEDLQKWVSNIAIDHLSKLVIHTPSTIINTSDTSYQQYLSFINSLNCRYTHLSTNNCSYLNNYSSKLPKLSTSVHCISELNQLSTMYSRAFISPIFPSISKKGYHSKLNWIDELKKQTNNAITLVALGGISPNNLAQIKDMGFNDFAVLGAVWQAPQPLKVFEQCINFDL